MKPIEKLRKKLAEAEKKLEQLSKEEAKARGKWTRAFHVWGKAAEGLAKITRLGTKRHAQLSEKVLGWPEESKALTVGRDAARQKMREQQEEITRLKIEIARLEEQDRAIIKAGDELVNQVFRLNDAVVEALLLRNEFLDQNVYHLLIDESGKLRSQITFDHSDGTKRVVAMVNTIAIVKADLAAKALDLIDQFFERLQPKIELDEATSVLYELCRKLLVERTKFKIGPDLYRFLSLDLDPVKTPELKESQTLLKQSIRSEKTNTYIRLYVRKDRTSKWEPVKQA